MKAFTNFVKDACVVGLLACVACGEGERVKNAADMTSYTAELTECRKKGKAAGSYDVYEACAIEVDKRHKVNGQ